MILLLSDDLLDASKTIASGRAVGVQVLQCKTAESLLQQIEKQSVECCIVDLQSPGLDIDQLVQQMRTTHPSAKVIAYGSHVDAERLKDARRAGCDEVMPRSQFFESMPEMIGEWGRLSGQMT